MTDRTLWQIVWGLTAIRLMTAAWAGLAPDETYYWLWAQHPAAGYYDHPPVVAWLIEFSTLMFGESALALRLPFVVIIGLLSPVLYSTAMALFADRAVARRAVLWLNASFLVSVGGILATPDPASVLLWTCAVWSLAKVLQTKRGVYWLAFGLCAGLGLEAKYTGFFLGLGVLLWLIVDREARRWWLTPWPWAAGLIAVLAFAPNLIWNLTHDMVTFTKQFGRVGPVQMTLDFVPELIGAQIGLINPLIAIWVGLAAWGYARGRGKSLQLGRLQLGPLQLELSLLFVLCIPLIAYMGVHVLHDRVQGNWPAPIHPQLILAAAVWAERHQATPRRWLLWVLHKAAPFGIGLSLLAMGYLILPEHWVKNWPDPAQLTRGWQPLADEVAQLSQETHASWVATADYTVTAALTYHLYRKLPVRGMLTRERYPWARASEDQPMTETRGLIIVQAHEGALAARCFTQLKEIRTLRRPVFTDHETQFLVLSGLLRTAGCDLDQ